jgi:hypothetical protein
MHSNVRLLFFVRALFLVPDKRKPVAFGALAALHVQSIAQVLATSLNVTSATWVEVYGFNSGLSLSLLAPLLLIGSWHRPLVPWNILAPLFMGHPDSADPTDSLYVTVLDVSSTIFSTSDHCYESVLG